MRLLLSSFSFASLAKWERCAVYIYLRCPVCRRRSLTGAFSFRFSWSLGVICRGRFHFCFILKVCGKLRKLWLGLCPPRASARLELVYVLDGTEQTPDWFLLK